MAVPETLAFPSLRAAPPLGHGWRAPKSAAPSPTNALRAEPRVLLAKLMLHPDDTGKEHRKCEAVDEQSSIQGVSTAA